MDEINLHPPMNEPIKNLLKLQTLEFDDQVESDMDKRIAELRTKIPAPILAHYDRLVARGKKGTAAIHHQVCTGCHVQVPRGTVLTLMHDDDIQICENCGRYLYLPEPSESAPAAAAPEKPRPRKQRAAVMSAVKKH
jgi:predicted  nucleic acid-binding Zn-ribbon protein